MIRFKLLAPFILPCLVAFAQDAGKPATREQAEALVKAAVAFAKEKGKDEMFKEVNFGSGRFHVRPGGDLYIFVYDMAGVVKAHGSTPSLVGVNRMGSKDPDGKEFIKEIVDISKTKTKKGWVDYKYPDPRTRKVEDKTAYIEYFDGVVIGAGVYKH